VSRLSSSFGRRLPAVLWAGAAALFVALVVLVALSFADRGQTPREAVAAYITDVNRIEVGLAAELRKVDNRYRKFGGNAARLERQAPELARAERTIRDLRRRLSALRPPPDAEPLHALIQKLLALELAFAGEVTDLASYLPRLAREQAPLAAGVAKLRRGVTGAKTAPDQARAFADYARATRAVADRMARASAPPQFVATRRAEVARLRRLADVSIRIESALEDGRTDDAVRLFASFARIAAASEVAKAEREAALAYNRRLKSIRRIARAIQSERARLDRELS
jgi:hypothetical protein